LRGAGLHWVIDSRAAPYKRFAENRFHLIAQVTIRTLGRVWVLFTLA